MGWEKGERKGVMNYCFVYVKKLKFKGIKTVLDQICNKLDVCSKQP